MQKILLLLLLFTQQLFAQTSEKYFNLEPFIQEQTELSNDISYLYLAPQFEENPDPDKAVVIEYYFGEFDDSQASINRLDFIKEIIQDDKKVHQDYPIEVLGVSANNNKKTKNFDQIIKHLDINDAKQKYEKIPDYIYFNPAVYDKTSSYFPKKESKRAPAGISLGRNFWTFMRFSAGAGSTYAALVISEGIAPGIAASVAFWPGMASGAITYFNGAYGEFMTSGSWAKWLLESDKKFAHFLRKRLGLNSKNLASHLSKTAKKYNKKTYFKKLLQQNPDEYTRIIERDAKIAFARRENRLKNIVKKFGMVDEYVKWWATEITFVTTSIKIPQVIAGVSASTSFIGGVGDVLAGGTMGMLAQGPGDLAIQKRKFQKLVELEKMLVGNKVKVTTQKEVKSLVKKGLLPKQSNEQIEGLVKRGYVNIDQADELLDQIKKVKDPNIKYTIGKNSHKALRKIENWARSRATLLSFFSVAGVGMEIAGIPLARPLLIGVGAGGALYYSRVSGWITKDKIKKFFKEDIKRYFAKIKAGEVKFSLKTLLLRLCTAKMKPKLKVL